MDAQLTLLKILLVFKCRLSNPADPVNIGTVGTVVDRLVGWGTSNYWTGRYIYMVSEYTGSNLQIYDMGGEYAQQLQAGNIQTSVLSVDNNASVGGDANITGGLTVDNLNR